jgi:hypothetical protein
VGEDKDAEEDVVGEEDKAAVEVVVMVRAIKRH